jgi:hypothetical protein
MKLETQRAILKQFFALRSAHTTTMAPGVFCQPSSVYVAAERLQAETDALFRGRPLVVGLSADLPDTGDVVATEVAGVPLLLIRGGRRGASVPQHLPPPRRPRVHRTRAPRTRA